VLEEGRDPGQPVLPSFNNLFAPTAPFGGCPSIPGNHTAAGLQIKIDMSIHDEYQIMVTEAQRRLIVRALTNAMVNDRFSTDSGVLTRPTADDWMQLIQLFGSIEPSVRKPALR